MKVAVATYYAVTNIGDKILTDVVTWMLKKNGHKVELVDLNARHPFRYNGLMGCVERWFCSWFVHRETSEQRRDYFRKTLKSADYILFGGGQIFDYRERLVNENIFTIIHVAENLNIPVSFNAVGFGGGANIC